MKTKTEIKEFLSQCSFQDVYSVIMSERAKDINEELMCIPQAYIGDEEGDHEQFGFTTMDEMIQTCQDNRIYEDIDFTFSNLDFS